MEIEYFVALPVPATFSRPFIAQQLQQACDVAGMAGSFKVIEAGTAQHVIIFCRSVGDDAEYVQVVRERAGCDLEQAIRLQLAAEIDSIDERLQEVLTNALQLGKADVFAFNTDVAKLWDLALQEA